MSTMPDHLRPITVEIPVTWTPEQALAVWEMLEDLLAEERRCAGIDDSDANSGTIDF